MSNPNEWTIFLSDDLVAEIWLDGYQVDYPSSDSWTQRKKNLEKDGHAL